MDWHRENEQAALDHFRTDREMGLAEREAALRLELHGPNKLRKAREKALWGYFLEQMKSPLIYILLMAAGVTAVLGETVDTAVILAVVLVNGLIGAYQEYKAEQSIRSLEKLAPFRARVLREGREEAVDASLLVPGDVVLLEGGNKVPADLRLFYAKNLAVDESILTGESVPVQKDSGAVLADAHAPLGDRINMAYAGTMVTAGAGRGVVVATGMETELGRISAQVMESETLATPLQRRLEQLSRLIGLYIGMLAGLVFLLGILMGHSLSHMFKLAVSLAVSAIPEGLPAVVTVTLSIGVYRMAKRNAIIRKLPAVETLGSLTVIGSDKTGTLTKNEMTVTRLYCAGRLLDVTGTGYGPAGEIRGLDESLRPAVEKLLLAGTLCNTAQLVEEDGAWRVEGDTTEGALLVAARKGGLEPEALRKAWTRLDEMPFDPASRYMATLVERQGETLLLVKGSLDRLLAMADSQEGTSGREPLNGDAWLAAEQAMAGEGLRVLAMACRPMAPGTRHIPEKLEGLTLLGFQAMMDPPREEVREAIANARQAGIRVVMITGDHKVTAGAIARKLGIDSQGKAVEGAEMDRLDAEELARTIDSHNVFARVSPSHKMAIVRHLQDRGGVVAMTGDGVNDAPALKRADVGIAMGITGTDVAKEAADMILADDNFFSIYKAVERGRMVFATLQNVIAYLISTGLAEVLTFLVSLLLGLPLPLLPVQILWVNLVTDGVNDVMLSFEPGERDVMKAAPRGREEGLLGRRHMARIALMALVMTAGTLGLFAYELYMAEAGLDKGRTMAYSALAIFQLMNAWNCRSFHRSLRRLPFLGNPYLAGAFVVSFGLQLMAVYVPFLQGVFHTVPLALADWVAIFAVALTVIIAVEAEKWLLRAGYLGKATGGLPIDG